MTSGVVAQRISEDVVVDSWAWSPWVPLRRGRQQGPKHLANLQGVVALYQGVVAHYRFSPDVVVKGATHLWDMDNH